MSAQPHRADTTILGLRLAIGLAQGAALYVLLEMLEGTPQPFTKTWLYAALVIAAGLLPFVWLAAIASMRMITLGIWSLGIIATIIATSTHAAWLDTSDNATDKLGLFFPLAAAVFIGHHLIAAADHDRKPLANYATYFDLGWKDGVQLVLCLAFLAAFWLLLWLGASLFELIGITAIRDLITERPFAFLASAAVFALAVHITDTRMSLVIGARTIALILLSWLLPLLALFAWAFLASLFFTGLAPLWATGRATALLVTAGAALVILINANYQDGDDERSPPGILKLAVRAAALALVPIAILAFYSVWLRVGQYGLTPERVAGLAIVGVGAIYATGYAVAALWPGRWMQPLQPANVAAAFAWIALIIGMLTPIADPARLSVDNQVNRLLSGAVTPDKFDFDALRFDTYRYGREALERLAADRSSPFRIDIADRAAEALKRTARKSRPAEDRLTADALRAGVTVFPAGSTLPDSLLSEDWSGRASNPLENCVRNAIKPPGCQALLGDLDNDGRTDVLLRENAWSIIALGQDANGKWVERGTFVTGQCNAPYFDFSTPGVSLAPPRPAPLELDVNGKRFQMTPACNP
ncbi:MAG: DUF4153 domain-containing protein [Alphaproteobacteria bacterium]|nr:DUF4153 domain-containing protein [Alphaproteobacteria bacterium]